MDGDTHAADLTQPKKERGASWRLRLALLGISLLLTVLALEGMARLLHLGTGGFWEPHPYYGWQNIPNASGWESCYGECDVYVEVNSQGLRDREIPYAKPTDVSRVLILGDSMTAGMQVPLEDTFAKVLETGLNDQGSSRWEVVNGGVNAFGTDNELLFYRLEGTRYEPDVVLVAMYLANDIYNNSRQLEVRLGGTGHKPYFVLEENGTLSLHNYPVEGNDSLGIRIGTFLKRHFQLPRAVAQLLNLRKNVPAVLRPLVELAGGRQPVENPESDGENAPASDAGNGGGGPQRRADICSSDYVPVIDEAWAITEALLLQLDEEVRAAGARLMVMAIPASPQVVPPAEGKDWYCDRPNRELDAFLAAEGIPFLDLLPVFRQHVLDGHDVPYYERDFHMTEDGHSLAGLALIQFVLEEQDLHEG